MSRYQASTIDREVATLYSSCKTNGTGAATDTRGVGVTWARTGVGVYTATLTTQAKTDLGNIISAMACAQVPQGTAVRYATVVQTSATVFTVTVVDAAGSPADMAAGTYNRLSIAITGTNKVTA